MLSTLIIGLIAGPGRIFVRIADGVAGDGGRVRGRTLAAVVAVLDVLLRVIPRAAAAGHRQGEEEAGDDRADEHAAHHLRAAVVGQHEPSSTTMIGTPIGISAGNTISRSAALVTMSTVVP